MYKVFIKDKAVDIPAEDWKDFKSDYELIEAAGGLVKNPKNEILFIHRLGKWDLPKGKIEKGEDKKTAAVREVEEECGISGLEILRELNPTYHTYELKGKNILKRTYWFEMQTDDSSELIPQTEENIKAACWINAENLEEQLRGTYGSVRVVLGEVLK